MSYLPGSNSFLLQIEVAYATEQPPFNFAKKIFLGITQHSWRKFFLFLEHLVESARIANLLKD